MPWPRYLLPVGSLGLAFLAGTLCDNVCDTACDSMGSGGKTIPRVRRIEEGSISPNRLEIGVLDDDGDFKMTTILAIDGKPYALRERDGRPVLEEYTLPKE
ncbi:MAG: hypothetical protein JSW08_00660 [archaeon]|nr:MAG: hypothetical protein JSW08_00660 [archaeon]